MFDQKDFNTLGKKKKNNFFSIFYFTLFYFFFIFFIFLFFQKGISVDDLIDGFLQSVMSLVAIDQLASKIQNKDGSFNFDLYYSLNKDKKFMTEFKL